MRYIEEMGELPKMPITFPGHLLITFHCPSCQNHFTGIAAIGSGGAYAQAAAKALFENTQLSAREIVEKSMKIAGNICIYTNENISIEELL